MLDTNVNRPDFAWLNESSRIFLHRGYLLEGTEPEDRIRYIADHAEKLLNYPGFADKFYHYMARGYYSLASPIWSNFGLDRGLPISCFGSWIGDSIYDIMSTTAEVGMMSKTGGGTSGYFGAIRPRGAPIKDNGHSDGSFNFAKLFDTVIDVISQGTCYEEGTEVLTDKGFKDFRDVKKGEDLLAHVDEYNNISYTDTYDLITEDHTGEMYHYYAEGKFDLSVTPNHRMVFGGYRYKGEGENIFPDWDEKTDIAQAKDLVLDDYTRLFYLDENTNVQWVVGSDVQVSKVDYQGKVYCATVPLGRLVVRRNNTVCVSGNSRKGQFAGYIDIEHPDIEEWLDIHKEGNPIQLMYYGVCIGDQWLKEMKEGDVEKRRIWAKVLQRKAESGIPYLFFKDNVNNQKPDVYKDKDMTIYASNLCVSGDTTILTQEYGHTPIAEHVGEFVTVWNGQEWSPNVQLVKTGENQQLYLVKLSNGREIKCTGYHKWFVKNDYFKDPVVMSTLELQHGFKLDKWSLPIMEGTLELEDAYTNGFYTGDGCYFKGANLIYLYHQKKALRQHITGNIISESFSTSSDRITLRMKGLRDKFFVPNHEYTIRSRLEWLAGYLDADGTIYRNDATDLIVAASINEDFLIEVQNMLSTLGVHSKLKLMHDERVSWLPLNDGSGDYGEYLSKRCYRLIISPSESQKLLDLGIKFHRLTIEKRSPNRSAYRYVSVESVWELSEKEDTYCCNEPLRHAVIFNGVKTSQCSEIALPSSLEESFVCCLSSMNALYFDEWKDTDAVETMTYFLDAVMEEFIQKSKSIPMMEKAHRFASRHRAIGIGVLGWHSYLQYKHVPFESFQAMQLNNELFKTIQERSHAASREMAEKYGEPEILKGYGRRNTTTMSVAPTKSSSFILGGVSPSVEPIRSNYYIKDLAKIKTTYRNPLLTKVLQEKGLDNEATWQSILVNDGSVQHLDGLSDEDKAVFKTWQEISQLTIIQQAAQRQKYIDQGQSINILVHPDTPTKDINQLYLTAHELGMKSIYYQFSMSAAQKFNRALLNTCTTCES